MALIFGLIVVASAAHWALTRSLGRIESVQNPFGLKKRFANGMFRWAFWGESAFEGHSIASRIVAGSSLLIWILGLGLAIWDGINHSGDIRFWAAVASFCVMASSCVVHIAEMAVEWIAEIKRDIEHNRED